MASFGTTLQQQQQRSSLFLCHADSDHEEPHYFLDSCSLCKTPLHAGDDIYMYKGDTPFCSEECRQEQIEIDEANERRRKKKNKKKLIESKIDTNDTASNSKSLEIPVRAAKAVVAS